MTQTLPPSYPIASVQAIGALIYPGSRAVFNRGKLVFEAREGFFYADGYTDHYVAGLKLAAEDFEGLLQSEQAIRLPHPAPLQPYAELWRLNGRDAAQQEADIHSYAQVTSYKDGDTYLCVVPAHKCAYLRDQWCDKALRDLDYHILTQHWHDAVPAGESALAYLSGATTVSVRHIQAYSGLILAYAMTGRTVRAKGLYKRLTDLHPSASQLP